MATTHELKEVIKDTLENRGVLGQIKARIRAEVFNAMDDQGEGRPPMSNENLLINELIREYLEFNKYKYTASVLLAESGQPKEPLNREFLAKELNVEEDRNTSSIPLLYSIVSHVSGQNRQLGGGSQHASRRGNRGAFLDEIERDIASKDGFRDQDPVIVKGGRR